MDAMSVTGRTQALWRVFKMMHRMISYLTKCPRANDMTMHHMSLAHIVFNAPIHTGKYCMHWNHLKRFP